jgi:hypothetical protein
MRLAFFIRGGTELLPPVGFWPTAYRIHEEFRCTLEEGMII